MKDPKRTPWQCTAFVCVLGVALGDHLEVSRSMEHDVLSLLSIYRRIFLCVFIVYRLLLEIHFTLLYSICLYVLVVLV